LSDLPLRLEGRNGRCRPLCGLNPCGDSRPSSNPASATGHCRRFRYPWGLR